MEVSHIHYQSIGVVHSPFTQQAGTPVQPSHDNASQGMIEIAPQYLEALQDLAGFSHIWVLCHLHQARQPKLAVTPYLDDKPHGLFATRAPSRPNPIGMSLVRLQKIEANRLYVQELDLLDGTPVLDIKPFVSQFDNREHSQCGWFETAANNVTQADDRFE
ncbi:tRNA (N6-threonylcarbamoyladenosine(37)-N6)-methyltransferase TrmO [Shewanella sp. C32]|uniref:tRNA (N6-threonylcarbamoyladenosine(37)-N6)-methyltransferase TrmO n=1 Tax=Shewanella electrica TaxID=515560 RepID=A0ABT2FHC6_9GAMM|nr:tRNA (N6-threonylcarbamoyladenosine(37)-N6)-methyltransferase TrmO [Shewanella electrica]MCH1923590.1 tRNA (N6-threonylcarbamoyladenosine(37)-N6)-methyltransferase TrmO [Shewanella electrica]MCS4555686.1 tRNA (N6-threonylcarbamoyladenosine(37)-N6)-methyltransferase TrmO [Shewanella electrica]